MTSILIIAGGAIFVILGSLHAIYTWSDIGKPRRSFPTIPRRSKQCLPPRCVFPVIGIGLATLVLRAAGWRIDNGARHRLLGRRSTRSLAVI
jgi:hypothetical protein